MAPWSTSHLIQFLHRSPTSWHAVEKSIEWLAENDFAPIEENLPIEVRLKGRYFVKRGGSFLACLTPQKKPRQLLVVISHTDSPGIKLKPSSFLSKEGWIQLAVEPYGAPILSSWLNRDLYLAGKVVLEGPHKHLSEKLLQLPEMSFTIPQIAIHLEREMNEKGMPVQKHEHLRPLLAQSGHYEKVERFDQLLQSQWGISPPLAQEWFLIPMEPPRVLGMEQELLSSYRLDNLSSGYAMLHALCHLKSSAEDLLVIAASFDHEEIGSRTYEGALSSFLPEMYERICTSLGLSKEESFALKARGLCLSLDVSHGYNPNYPQKYDPQHLPHLGQGINIKFHADQKYANSSITVAQVENIARKKGLRTQAYSPRADIPSGSTIGPLVTSSFGIPTIDIGCALWSMHSIRETIHLKDMQDLSTLIQGLATEGIYAT